MKIFVLLSCLFILTPVYAQNADSLDRAPSRPFRNQGMNRYPENGSPIIGNFQKRPGQRYQHMGEQERLRQLRMINPNGVEQGLRERILIKSILETIQSYPPLQSGFEALSEDQRAELAEILRNRLRAQRKNISHPIQEQQGGPPHPLYEARSEFKKVEQEVHHLAETYASSNNPEEKAQLKDMIRKRLKEGYDKRLEAETQKLRDFEKRIQEYQQQLQQRQVLRDEMIDQHLQEVLSGKAPPPPPPEDPMPKEVSPIRM